MYVFVMRFRKPWFRVKLVDFDFSAKLSSSDYNESNKQSTKSLARRRSKKSLVGLVPKTELFHFLLHFSLYLKVYFSPTAMVDAKLSSTGYNKSNEPNPRSITHIESEKSLIELGVPKNGAFSHFSLY